MGIFETRITILALRIAQVILAIVVLGLTAYVAHWWSNYWHAMSPSQINFLIFDAVWTMLVLLYLIIVPWRFDYSIANHIFAILTAELLTMIFWFAGFIALAVFLADRVCFGHVCSAAKAAAVFGAFEWAVFVGTTVLAARQIIRARGSGGASARGKPDPNLNIQEGV